MAYSPAASHLESQSSRQRQRIHVFVIAGRHTNRARRAREEIDRVLMHRERKRRAVSADTLTSLCGDGVIHCSFTVPTLPPLISKRWNISGEIQRSRFAKSSGEANSYRIAESAGWNPSTTIFGLPSRATITGPASTSPILPSPARLRIPAIFRA